MGRLTLIELLDTSAAEYGELPALIASGGPQLTHKELQVAIEKTAAQLRRIGVKPGNLVSLAFPNTFEVR
jgi:non-ribosomal peptide synthetase component E (peptide arylation enzyme)